MGPVITVQIILICPALTITQAPSPEMFSKKKTYNESNENLKLKLLAINTNTHHINTRFQINNILNTFHK